MNTLTLYEIPSNQTISIMNPGKILLLFVVFFTANSLTAQIHISADSVPTVLCQKWGFKAILMGGQRLTNMNESVTYDFTSNGKLKRISSNGKGEIGTWIYKPEQNIVLLKIKKTTLHIPSLSNQELIVSPGDGVAAGKNGLGIGTILKPINTN